MATRCIGVGFSVDAAVAGPARLFDIHHLGRACCQFRCLTPPPCSFWMGCADVGQEFEGPPNQIVEERVQQGTATEQLTR